MSAIHTPCTADVSNSAVISKSSKKRWIPADVVQNTAEYSGSVASLVSFRGVSSEWQGAVSDAVGFLNGRCWTRLDEKRDGPLWRSLCLDMVRFRMHVILTPVGVALMGIVPSRMPVTLDAVLRIVSFRFCTAVFVGITPSAGLVSFAITDFAVQVTSLLVFRSRNRWAYVDYAIAKHAKVTWTATRLAIEEMLAHLLPKEVAQQITQFKPDEVTASHATVVCLSVWCADDENPETHAADVTMVEECNPACSHDVHIRTILQTMPSVASGAVHVQQHGSRWLLFGNLGDEFDCVDTDELREEVAEAALRITVAIKTTRITVHQFEGMLSGAVVGHVAARMFVAVGPALDEALLAARGSTPGDADDAK
jgi:hypothetical protein